jgi:spore coat protein CotH
MRTTMPRRAASLLFASALLALDAWSAGAQTTDDLFDAETLQEVRLVMSPRDVTTMRANFGENTYYPADLQWRDLKVRNVAVRSRGSGSRSGTKPGLQLDFNYYVKGQQFLGLKSLVLDNLWQDPSMVRERVAMQFYQRMGQPAPRESFCRLYINDVYVGVYGVLETITPELLQRTVGESDGYLFEYHYSGPFYGEYLGDKLAAYAQLFEPRSHQRESDTVLYSPLRDLFREVNGPDDAVWRERVEAYVDLPQLIRYVAIETFLSEYDGILSPTGMSNFYIYRPNGTTQHRFIPWDKDRTFSEFDSSVVASIDTNILFRRALAYADLKTLYLDTLASCARSARIQFWLDREIARTVAVIATAAAEDPLKPYTNDDFASAVSYLRTFARRRSVLVLKEIASIRASGSAAR